MKFASLAILLAAVPIAAAQTRAAAITTVPQAASPSEPGVYPIDRLFAAADIVAVVHVLSGDAENYDNAIYKAEVVQNFKGTQVGQILYFGPYVGTAIGSEYVLFLKAAPKPAVPKSNPSSGYGSLRWYSVFDEGYSSMGVSYECRFSGKEIATQCDYAVRVCTDYIKLPDSVTMSPPTSEGTPFGCRYVRRPDFLALLSSLQTHP